MGWFDEQIKQRIKLDNDEFSDAFASMAGVVMGERVSRALENDHIQTKNAIDEILKYYHIKPQELPDDVTDVNDQLEYLLRPTGIMHRTVKLEGEWYKDAIGAMLATRTDNGMLVALLPDSHVGYHFYHFFDTQTGKWVKLNKKTAGLINQEALCFYKPLPLRKLGVRDLVIYMLECISVKNTLMIVASATIAVMMGMLITALSKLVYGIVIESGSRQLWLAVFGCLFCVSLSQIMIDMMRRMILSRFGNRVTLQVQAACMMRLLSLPSSFFKKYSSGDLAARIKGVSDMCSLFLKKDLAVVVAAVFSLAYVSQMIIYAPGLVAPGLFVILSMVVVSALTTYAQTQLSKRQMALAFQEEGLEYALITGIQKIKLSGAEKRAFSKWAKAYTKQSKLLYDPPAYLRLSNVYSCSITLIGTAIIYYYAIETGVSVSNYYAFNTAYGMLLGAFVALNGIMSELAKIISATKLIEPILEEVPEVSESKKKVTKLGGAIELNNVSFQYRPEGPLIIDGLNLKIKPGQYVAIVGYTGCGKSTLMRLLLGFETPQKGAVYYDGKDLATLDLKSLRRNIGTVMQNDKLFQGDIYSNIVVSAPELDMDAAWEAAELAGVADDIRAMPMGMHTVISEGSGGISGGQRQRLVIARAIVNKPKILMFDEATSALDNITQKTVSESLDALKCTRIVIAHRLSTIRNCDRIIVLDHGKIIEDGSYEELMEANGFFTQLVERQRVK